MTIEDELVKVCNFRVAMRGSSNQQTFSARLIKHIDETITNKAWNSLSLDAQRWFNDSIDDLNAGREIRRPLSVENLSVSAEALKSGRGLGASKRRTLWNYNSKRAKVVRFLVQDRFSSIDPADAVRALANDGDNVSTETAQNMITLTLVVIGELMKGGWFQPGFDFDAIKDRIEASNERLN